MKKDSVKIAIAIAALISKKGAELIRRGWTIKDLHELDKARRQEGYPPLFFKEEN